MISQKLKDDMILLSNICGCSLDNKPSKVVGWMLDFALVATLDGAQTVEFSWNTVKRIMDKDGKFSS